MQPTDRRAGQAAAGWGGTGLLPCLLPCFQKQKTPLMPQDGGFLHETSFRWPRTRLRFESLAPAGMHVDPQDAATAGRPIDRRSPPPTRCSRTADGRQTADGGQRTADSGHGTVLCSRLQLYSVQRMTRVRFGRVRRSSHDAESRHSMQRHTALGRVGPWLTLPLLLSC